MEDRIVVGRLVYGRRRNSLDGVCGARAAEGNGFGIVNQGGGDYPVIAIGPASVRISFLRELPKWPSPTGHSKPMTDERSVARPSKRAGAAICGRSAAS
jgi:hypothetical protein